jgi:hypothetical protein
MSDEKEKAASTKIADGWPSGAKPSSPPKSQIRPKDEFPGDTVHNKGEQEFWQPWDDAVEWEPAGKYYQPFPADRRGPGNIGVPLPTVNPSVNSDDDAKKDKIPKMFRGGYSIAPILKDRQFVTDDRLLLSLPNDIQDRYNDLASRVRDYAHNVKTHDLDVYDYPQTPPDNYIQREIAKHEIDWSNRLIVEDLVATVHPQDIVDWFGLASMEDEEARELAPALYDQYMRENGGEVNFSTWLIENSPNLVNDDTFVGNFHDTIQQNPQTSFAKQYEKVWRTHNKETIEQNAFDRAKPKWLEAIRGNVDYVRPDFRESIETIRRVQNEERVPVNDSISSLEKALIGDANVGGFRQECESMTNEGMTALDLYRDPVSRDDRLFGDMEPVGLKSIPVRRILGTYDVEPASIPFDQRHALTFANLEVYQYGNFYFLKNETRDARMLVAQRRNELASSHVHVNVTKIIPGSSIRKRAALSVEEWGNKTKVLRAALEELEAGEDKESVFLKYGRDYGPGLRAALDDFLHVQGQLKQSGEGQEGEKGSVRCATYWHEQSADNCGGCTFWPAGGGDQEFGYGDNGCLLSDFFLNRPDPGFARRRQAPGDVVNQLATPSVQKSPRRGPRSGKTASIKDVPPNIITQWSKTHRLLEAYDRLPTLESFDRFFNAIQGLFARAKQYLPPDVAESFQRGIQGLESELMAIPPGGDPPHNLLFDADIVLNQLHNNLVTLFEAPVGEWYRFAGENTQQVADRFVSFVSIQSNEIHAQETPEGPVPTPAVNFYQATPEEFFHAISEMGKYKGFLSPFDVDDYKDMQCFLNRDKNVGYAITADKELVSVFNNSRIVGAGKIAVKDAVTKGAQHGSAFDGFLVDFYRGLGFQEYKRSPFADEYAPEWWDYGKFGKPDVVYMKHPDYQVKESHFAVRKAQFTSEFIQQVDWNRPFEENFAAIQAPEEEDHAEAMFKPSTEDSQRFVSADGLIDEALGRNKVFSAADEKRPWQRVFPPHMHPGLAIKPSETEGEEDMFAGPEEENPDVLRSSKGIVLPAPHVFESRNYQAVLNEAPRVPFDPTDPSSIDRSIEFLQNTTGLQVGHSTRKMRPVEFFIFPTEFGDLRTNHVVYAAWFAMFSANTAVDVEEKQFVLWQAGKSGGEPGKPGIMSRKNKLIELLKFLKWAGFPKFDRLNEALEDLDPSDESYERRLLSLSRLPGIQPKVASFMLALLGDQRSPTLDMHAIGYLIQKGKVQVPEGQEWTPLNELIGQKKRLKELYEEKGPDNLEYSMAEEEYREKAKMNKTVIMQINRQTRVFRTHEQADRPQKSPKAFETEKRKMRLYMERQMEGWNGDSDTFWAWYAMNNFFETHEPRRDMIHTVFFQSLFPELFAPEALQDREELRQLHEEDPKGLKERLKYRDYRENLQEMRKIRKVQPKPPQEEQPEMEFNWETGEYEILTK